MSPRQNIQSQPPGALARLVLVRFAAVLATLTAAANQALDLEQPPAQRVVEHQFWFGR